MSLDLPARGGGLLVLVRTLAVLTTLALLITALIPLPIPGLTGVSAPLSLMAVYFWAVRAPDLLPAPAVFAIGLLADLVGGAPPGVTSLLLLGIHWWISSQRLIPLASSFALTWVGFAVVATGFMLAEAVLALLLGGAWPDPQTTLVGLAFAVAVFPLAVALVLAPVARLRPEAR